MLHRLLHGGRLYRYHLAIQVVAVVAIPNIGCLQFIPGNPVDNIGRPKNGQYSIQNLRYIQ